MGGRNRQTDARASFIRRCQEKKRELRPRPGNCDGTNALYLSCQSKCSVGGIDNSSRRQPCDSGSANILEYGSAVGEVSLALFRNDENGSRLKRHPALSAPFGPLR